MSTRVTTEPATGIPTGVSQVQGGDQSHSTPESSERVAKLDPAAQPRPFVILSLPPDESEGTPEEIHQSCREEIQRRLDWIASGKSKSYTVEETLAYLDKLCGTDGES